MGEKVVGAGAASKGIVVMGKASEATIHEGTVRWRRRWRWSGAMGGERETRRGMLMCCTAAVKGCTVHRVRLTLVTRTRRLDWCHLGRRVLSLHCEDRMNNSILTIKCSTVVLCTTTSRSSRNMSTPFVPKFLS